MAKELSIYDLESVVFDVNGWTPSGLYVKHEFWPEAHRAKFIYSDDPKLQPVPSTVQAKTLCDLFNERHPTMKLYYYLHANMWLAMDKQ